MTPVRMVHPLHGAMHAYNHDEIERLELLGWSPEVAINEVKVVNAAIEKARRGRPPKVRNGDDAEHR